MIERITYKNKLFSIIIRTNYKEEGIKFFYTKRIFSTAWLYESSKRLCNLPSLT